ncbi:DsbA family protein [Kineococcus terrestris]|uniref:DsbA family protein n=1 Tax=Kineococcus terrestris TaxID=2044856 RepID=UPI0034DB367A
MSSRKRPGGNPARAGQAEDAREARRAKAAALRERELARERRRRVTLVTTAVVVALAVVAAVVVLVLRQRDASTSTEGATPAAATSASGGIVLPGSPAEGAAPTVDLWLDYQCPFCAQLEDTTGEAFTELAADGEARVVVHTVTFLDANLRNDSSERAASAAAAAAEQDRFAEYTRVVFAGQPGHDGNPGSEGDGYTDEQLRSFAEEAGVPDLEAWQRAYDEGTYVGYVRRVEAARGEQGVQGTPTVRLTPAGGGEAVDLDASQLIGAQGPQYLREQVAAVAAS